MIMVIVVESIVLLLPGLQVLILVAIGAGTYGLAWKVAQAKGWT